MYEVMSNSWYRGDAFTPELFNIGNLVAANVRLGVGARLKRTQLRRDIFVYESAVAKWKFGG